MTNIVARNFLFPNLSDNLDITVRGPTAQDIEGLAVLFSEMQRHYRRPVSDEQAVQAATLASQRVQTIFDPRVLIATIGGSIAGSIVLNVTFPAFELSRSLYIRDLYVAQPRRRCGVGQRLVRAAAQLTYAQGFSALDWTTETGNVAARQMYESCGARLLGRTYYRLAREDMETCATTQSPTSIATPAPRGRGRQAPDRGKPQQIARPCGEEGGVGEGAGS